MEREVRRCTVQGPLAPWASGFEDWLLERGYRPSAAFHRCCLLAVMSRWLERRGLAASELTEEGAVLFVAERRAAGLKTWAAEQSVRLPLEYLREVGAVPPPVVVLDNSPVAQLLANYREYLVLERGLAESTIDRCQRAARLFLEQMPDGRQIGELTAGDVSAFLARESPLRTGSGAISLMSKFRPFLRYLHVSGLVATPLVWAVPRAASLRDRSLPRAVEPAVVDRLLGSCDRRRTVGHRDYAILLVLIRLGLRAGEVAALTLEDVDWRGGEVLVHGKGNRHDVLPLPVNVGEAVVSYLCSRGRDQCPAVFVKARRRRGRSAGTRSRRSSAGRASAPRCRSSGRIDCGPPQRPRCWRNRARLRPLARPWPGGRR
jgi:integrase/recombinase XerD